MQAGLGALGDFAAADIARAGAEFDAAGMSCVRALAEASADAGRTEDGGSISREQKERAAEKASEQRSGGEAQDGRGASERAREGHGAIVRRAGQKNR